VRMNATTVIAIGIGVIAVIAILWAVGAVPT
jgi:nitrogen fixation-related uncharacterized protein